MNVLPEAFAHDRDRLDDLSVRRSCWRYRTISNIAAIYGLEESDRAIFLWVKGSKNARRGRLGVEKEDPQNLQSVLVSESFVSEIVEPSDAVQVLIDDVFPLSRGKRFGSRI
jgi:hypothetical protein